MLRKVGDKVRVRPDLTADRRYGLQKAVNDMPKLAGKFITIKELREFNYIVEEDDWFWTDEMFVNDNDTSLHPTVTSKAGFQKADGTKNRLELIQPEFIEGLGSILTGGAIKYAPNNWKLAGAPEDIERIKGALFRHHMAYIRGELLDPDSGLPHVYHMTCNLMFLDYFDRQKESL